MFERLKTWIKGGLQRMAANTGMAREFKMDEFRYAVNHFVKNYVY